MQKEMNMITEKVQALRQDGGKMEMETARKVKIQKQEIKETSPLKVKMNQTGNQLKNNSTTTTMA